MRSLLVFCSALLLAATHSSVLAETCTDQATCAAVYEPICATNGGTYMSRCQFDAAHCKNATIVSAHQGECRRQSRKKPLILLLGDSITQMGFDPNLQGWGLRLAYDYLRQIDVLNRGYGGYTTKWFLEFAMPELLADIRKYEPTLITLWLGTNDGALGGPQQVTISQYRFNLQLLVRQIQKAAPKAKVLLIAAPPVRNPDHSESIKQHGQVVLELAKTLKLDALDLYEYFMTKFPTAAQRDALSLDGIHFNVAGNAELYNAIRSKIVSILPSNALKDWQSPNYDELFLIG